MHYIIFSDQDEVSIINAKHDAIEAINYARAAANTYVNDFYQDVCHDTPESERPVKPELKETFITEDRGKYYFNIETDCGWAWTVQRFNADAL